MRSSTLRQPPPLPETAGTCWNRLEPAARASLPPRPGADASQREAAAHGPRILARGGRAGVGAGRRPSPRLCTPPQPPPPGRPGRGGPGSRRVTNGGGAEPRGARTALRPPLGSPSSARPRGPRADRVQAGPGRHCGSQASGLAVGGGGGCRALGCLGAEAARSASRCLTHAASPFGGQLPGAFQTKPNCRKERPCVWRRAFVFFPVQF